MVVWWTSFLPPDWRHWRCKVDSLHGASGSVIGLNGREMTIFDIMTKLFPRDGKVGAVRGLAISGIWLEKYFRNPGRVRIMVGPKHSVVLSVSEVAVGTNGR